MTTSKPRTWSVERGLHGAVWLSARRSLLGGVKVTVAVWRWQITVWPSNVYREDGTPPTFTALRCKVFLDRARWTKEPTSRLSDSGNWIRLSRLWVLRRFGSVVWFAFGSDARTPLRPWPQVRSESRGVSDLSYLAWLGFTLCVQVLKRDEKRVTLPPDPVRPPGQQEKNMFAAIRIVRPMGPGFLDELSFEDPGAGFSVSCLGSVETLKKLVPEAPADFDAQLAADPAMGPTWTAATAHATSQGIPVNDLIEATKRAIMAN